MLRLDPGMVHQLLQPDEILVRRALALGAAAPLGHDPRCRRAARRPCWCCRRQWRAACPASERGQKWTSAAGSTTRPAVGRQHQRARGVDRLEAPGDRPVGQPRGDLLADPRRPRQPGRAQRREALVREPLLPRVHRRRQEVEELLRPDARSRWRRAGSPAAPPPAPAPPASGARGEVDPDPDRRAPAAGPPARPSRAGSPRPCRRRQQHVVRPLQREELRPPRHRHHRVEQPQRRHERPLRQRPRRPAAAGSPRSSPAAIAQARPRRPRAAVCRSAQIQAGPVVAGRARRSASALVLSSSGWISRPTPAGQDVMRYCTSVAAAEAASVSTPKRLTTPDHHRRAPTPPAAPSAAPASARPAAPTASPKYIR